MLMGQIDPLQWVLRCSGVPEIHLGLVELAPPG